MGAQTKQSEEISEEILQFQITVLFANPLLR